ncbi:hypothetical protein GGI11_008907 [Coemansia sp. RSA 2049]|nr:hypothetical protein GGI11_008907 [Coemansia sp. RSA 2049]KAJ2590523.1 hypothetical protein EV177_009053 [Coemansia sp. RSA 1804]KAJ2642770.1 hypothetical protein GGH99_008676 [Coemansia sp. RSA 1285]
MPNLFNQPLLCLLSPTAYPTTTNSSGGSIYTFFLYSPVVAFSVVSQIAKLSADKWLRLEAMFAELEDLSFDLIVAHVTDPNTRRFLSDDFLRQIVCRHVVCCAVLALHRDFSRPENRPQSAPESLADVVSAPALLRKVRDMVEFCSAEELYQMEDEAPSSSLKEQQQQQRGSGDGDSGDNDGADGSSAGEERAVHASPVPATPALSPQQSVLSADNQEHSTTTST